MKFAVSILVTCLLVAIGFVVGLMVRVDSSAMLLKSLGSHLPAYRLENESNNPSVLRDLAKNGDADYYGKIINLEKTLVYRGRDLAKTSSPEMIIAYDSVAKCHAQEESFGFVADAISIALFVKGTVPSRSILFADGTVMVVSEDELIDVIQKDNEARIDNGFPVIDDEKFVGKTKKYAGEKTLMTLRIVSVLIALILAFTNLGMMKYVFSIIAVLSFDIISYLIWQQSYTYIEGEPFLIAYVLSIGWLGSNYRKMWS